MMFDYNEVLQVAIEEAKIGLTEGGVPVGACLVDENGTILGRGHNQRVQKNDPTIHGETDAFKQAGRQRGYHSKTMVTTLAPCWYCSGLIRQFNIGTVIVGDAVNFQGGMAWLKENGVKVVDLNNPECIEMMGAFIKAKPDLWAEDIGE
jgi:cytosine/creatinine deaminase